MSVVVLVRHGRTTANATGVLAGWTPDVHLDDVGRQQAEAAAQRLAPLSLSAIVSSPLDRTRETAAAIAAAQRRPITVDVDDRAGECEYGDWTGKALKDLAKEPLWKTVQARPSAVTFPEGESMLHMQQRAVAAVHDWNARVGPRGLYVVVSHGDVIKSILCDALGMHLDTFQRIVVDPASISVVRYTKDGTTVLRMNDMASDLSDLAVARRRRSSAAAVGGGSGQR
jgi:probable phosphomutase (TIGR03848 family)